MGFKLSLPFKPTGDQPQAIEKLVKGINLGLSDQVLLGVTGSGKTFTIANVIEKTNRPTLVISHNKTLAAQLYQEFKSFFPQNAVSFFVSYYDYYQPEAYIPQTDTYIQKEVDINEEIDKLRLEATTNLLTKKDTIIVASVSCIYNIGSPREYGHFVLELSCKMKTGREQILQKLTDLQYERGDYEFKRGRFRVKGETIDIYPAYQDQALRVEIEGDAVKRMYWLEPLTGKPITNLTEVTDIVIYPAKHYLTNPASLNQVFKKIKYDLKIRVKELKDKGKILEAERLRRRVNYDLEMIAELGYVNGIENYSRYFDGRNPGDPPYTLLDYFSKPYGKDWLLIIDESHQTIPQLNGMYQGDYSRKKALVEHGFRLPAAFDNRPLKFNEFLRRIPQVIYVSATPQSWEVKRSQKATKKFRFLHSGVVEQLVRPTGLVDPKINIKPTKKQVDDLIKEIKKRVKRRERVLVTTLTKRTAEDLAEYLDKVYYGDTYHHSKKPTFPSPSAPLTKRGSLLRPSKENVFPASTYPRPTNRVFLKRQIKIAYLHSDIETLKRQDILEDLRRGNYDVLVGINLLREGLDLPEVSLVAILDADKEGFLRSKTSLIQTMGRAARHVRGEVILYADKVTKSIREAIKEVERRRKLQLAYNKKYKITPKTIVKPIREKLAEKKEGFEAWRLRSLDIGYNLNKIDLESLTPMDKKRLIKRLKKEMKKAASNLNFELAAVLRDKIKEIRES